jgi:glycosyltransferase involved in cell wall biosynthesis
MIKTNTMPLNSVRVCLIHTQILPYRLPIFEELSKKVDLDVIFCKAITKDRKWKYDLNNYSFKRTILHGFSLGPVIFNTNIVSKLWKSKYDVIIVSNEPEIAPTAIIAFIIAKLKRWKILEWSQVFDYSIYFFPALAYSDKKINKAIRNWLSGLIMLYRRFCIFFADHFVVLGGRAKEFLTHHGVATNDITNVLQVMPMELLPEPTVKYNRNGHTFLYIGYFNKGKGIESLIVAFKRIKNKNAQLIIAGAGNVESQIKKMIGNDVRINLFCYVEGSEKANLYARSDIFILPTLNDSWGIVINEAIHYGLAIICSDAAAAVEIIDDEGGIIIPPNNTDKLYRAMMALIDDQDKLKIIQDYNSRNFRVSDTPTEVNGFLSAIRKTLL